MDSTSSRQDSRRVEARRINCRRVNRYSFGSDKWIRVIKASYLLWPKVDRRQRERRYLSRRDLERRILLRNYHRNARYLTLNEKIRRQGLTREEKNMIYDLMGRSSTKSISIH